MNGDRFRLPSLDELAGRVAREVGDTRRDLADAARLRRTLPFLWLALAVIVLLLMLNLLPRRGR